jgi:hypothetical protein
MQSQRPENTRFLGTFNKQKPPTHYRRRGFNQAFSSEDRIGVSSGPVHAIPDITDQQCTGNSILAYFTVKFYLKLLEIQIGMIFSSML